MLAIGWTFRELSYFSKKTTATSWEQRFLLEERERLHYQQTCEDLRDTNTHLQSLFKEYSTSLFQYRKELEQKMEDSCHKALVQTQQTFFTHLDPLLQGMQQQTYGHLKEHSAWLNQLMSPLERGLQTLSQQVQSLEQARMGAYEGMKEQILHLSKSHQLLCTETNTLSTALKTPHIRGCWGEMQLKRVVELAGMTSFCDFEEQPSLKTTQNTSVRPDMIIRLPEDKYIIVDAKTPLLHYLEALSEKTSHGYAAKLKEHAKTLSHHIRALSEKRYWALQENTLELTILFVPGEAFLSSALESDAGLMEYAAEKNIILATPMSLIALLKTISHGWRQQIFSRQHQQLVAMAKRLSQTLQTFQTHMKAVGKNLQQANGFYERASQMLDKEVVPLMKEFQGGSQGAVLSSEGTGQTLENPISPRE